MDLQIVGCCWTAPDDQAARDKFRAQAFAFIEHQCRAATAPRRAAHRPNTPLAIATQVRKSR